MKYIILVSSLLLLTNCGPVNNMCRDNEEGLHIVCNDVFGYNYEQREKQERLDLEQNLRLNQIEGSINSLELESKDQKNLISTLSLNALFLQSQIDLTNENVDLLQTSLDSSVVALQNSILSQSSLINNLQNNVDNNTTLITSVQNSLNNTINLISSIQNTLSVNTIDIQALQQAVNLLNNPVTGVVTNLQSSVNSNTVNIAILQGYQNITSMLDPCGDAPNKYDEVFLRLSTEVILASFSDNANGLNTRFSVIEPSDSLVYSTTDGSSCNFKVPKTGINAKKVCWGPGYSTCI